MKKTYVILAVILLPIVLISTVSCTGNTMRKTNPAIEKRIDNIIDQMTFDEKIAYLGGTGHFCGRTDDRRLWYGYGCHRIRSICRINPAKNDNQ